LTETIPPLLNTPVLDSLNGLLSSFAAVKGRQPEVSFSVGTESYAGRTHDMASIKQEIEKTP